MVYIGNNNSLCYFWELLCRKMVKNDFCVDNGCVRINIIWVSMYNIFFYFYVFLNKFLVFIIFNSFFGKSIKLNGYENNELLFIFY